MAGSRAWRWGLGLGVPLGALALLLVLFRWDWLIPLAEARASAALGRPVRIEHLHVQLGAPLRLRLEGVRIGNPEGFAAEPPLAALPVLEAELALRPLLHGAFVLPLVRLERPALAVLTDDKGQANYLFPAGEDGGEPPRIGRLEITDGTAQVVLPALRSDFRLGFATEGDAITAEAHGTYAAQPIEARFEGGALLSLRDETQPWPVKLDLRNGPTRLQLEGTVQHPLHVAGADLRLVLAGPDMKLLTPLTGVPLASTPPYRVAGRLDWDHAAGAVRFSGMQGKVGSSDLAGEVSVVPGRERPLVTARLESERLDLADLGGFVGSQPGRRATPGQTPEQRAAVARAEADPRLLPDAPLNLPKLRAADVRLSFHGKRIIDERVPLDDFAVEAVIENGAVTLQPLRFGVGRGQIGGTLHLAPQGEGLAARGNFELRRVEVARLLAPMGVRGGGTLGGVAEITGQGRSLAQLLGNGNGALTVAMVGGNLSSLIVDLSGLQFGRALLSALGIPERTGIRCLVGDFALRRGVLETRTFVLDTDSSVVFGAGSVDLGRETLDLRLRTASKGFTIGSLPTTIGVGGRFKSPSIIPDVGELVLRGGAAAGLGVLLPPLALLPTIQLGVGDDQQCEGIVAAARRGGG